MTETTTPTNQATAEPATLAITIEIIRAGTGKKEIYELVGTPVPAPEDQSVPKG